MGYRFSHALPAVHSFKRALPGVRRGLSRITVPYCSIMAANDRTVPPDNQTYIFNHIHSREKRAYMFIMPPDLTTMHSLLTHERARDRVLRYVETFIQETLEESGVAEKENGRSGGLSGWFRRKRLRRPQNLVEP